MTKSLTNREIKRGRYHRLFKHAASRRGHARQLRPDFYKIVDDIVKYFGLPANDRPIRDSLEAFLELEASSSLDHELVERRMHERLPLLAPGHAEYITSERLKGLDRIYEKISTRDRDTYDTYGIQLWPADPKLMYEFARLDSAQHPLRKEWEAKGIKVKFDNHAKDVKPHGYFAYHANFLCSGKGWEEGLEFQVAPALMIQTYLETRDPYIVLRALEEYVKRHRGKEEDGRWTDKDKDKIYPLRHYIRARYEADIFCSGLTGMLGSPTMFRNEKHAAQIAENLEQQVLDLIAEHAKHKHDVTPILENANS